MYHRFLKRLVDVVLSGLALVVLSPLLFAIAVAIRIEDGGPALFVQVRVGREARHFRLLKFRSMPVSARNLPSAQAGGLRITRVGRWIRRTNIDELPQLVNILKGDMSIVGPRPAIPSQTELLRMRDRNGASRLRPGLTGMAQINAYDGMPDREKAEWDGRYAKRSRFVTDLVLVFRTFAYLLKPPPKY